MPSLFVPLCLLTLAGCSHPWHGSGVVTAKQFIPAHDYETVGIISYYPSITESCSMIGTTESCYPVTNLIPIYGPVTLHAGDDWVLFVKDAKGKTHRLSVKPWVYALNPGATFDSKINR